GSKAYDLPPTRQGYSISAHFEYSPTGSSGPFYDAVVKDPMISTVGGTTIITVTSEDSNDQDNNDSYLIISYKQL
ncbi:hypothetical protein, partial [Winogradskyella sp.]|uniref:hypothetical protein n=1 Tax=Winogradskyella sp. TaxID=1883156 RepID=UPI0023527EEF